MGTQTDPTQSIMKSRLAKTRADIVFGAMRRKLFLYIISKLQDVKALQGGSKLFEAIRN